MKRLRQASGMFSRLRYSLIIPFLVLTFILISFGKRASKPRVLVFSKTKGWHHSSIPNGVAAVRKLGIENNFDVDTTTDASKFDEENLKKYATVVFMSTTGDVLDPRQEVAFERYIQAGGGYVGVHSAADTEYDWGWYGRLVGGYFYDHPGIHDTARNVQQGMLNVVDQTNISTKHLPKQWQRTDEFYSFKKLATDTKVLITLDESTYNGGKKMGNHPMTWYHEFDGGRAFYTALGHTEESYTDPAYLKHLLGGIQYAIGDNTPLSYGKAKSQYAPVEDRFTKTMLAEGVFFEPTEMTILPNFNILIAQRRGEIMMYDNNTKKVKQVGFLNVYWKTNTPGVNAEEGVLGLNKDPNFAKNNWIYIFYSPIDSSVNRLSRFTFKNDTLDYASEKTILEVKSQREICCHTGGSIAFGPDGLLYLSAGDNSTPFNEPKAQFTSNSFAPLNDLPGKMQYDARRSAGNTNDLRGKIMRIRVKDDATYEIPEGNLFPKGTAKTRPEIYVMGNRNPYRISVDQKNSNLYWGEVGPDANSDSAARGPRGYDEVNQARKAGFFGWPYLVGNNYPYREYDYATGTSGITFDPAHAVNNSRNNTGLRDIPPVSPAFIWYPYDVSPDFPQLGTGGRNAMAGPVYYTDMFPQETRLPDYYNGKLIIYDWIRGWMKAVTMLPNGDFDKMEPFMEHTKLRNCIDMEVGPDGKLYLLEYGSGWFAKNEDAGLSRIDYNAGNIAPRITKINVNKTSGNLPLAIKASVTARDPESEKMTYTWDFGNGITKMTTTPAADYTYTKAGDYKVRVFVKDQQGATSRSEDFSVYAGNAEPKVSIKLIGANKSFYVPGTPIKYAVTVTDNNLPVKIDPANLFVSVEYVEGFDKAASALGHQQGAATISGKNLMLSLDCKGCHKENEKSIGPAYMAVSEKYQKQRNAMNYLTQKIIKGGAGVWGEVSMPAHPQLSPSDANQIVTWVLSLANKSVAAKSLPAVGTITPEPTKPLATLLLSASYTDKGGNNIKALTGQNTIALKSNNITFKGSEKMKGFTSMTYNRANMMMIPQGGGWFALDDIDLTGVKNASIVAGWQKAPEVLLQFEARLDSPTGPLLGEGGLTPKAGQQSATIVIPIKTVPDGKSHTIYFVSKAASKEPLQAAIRSVQFGG